MHRPSPPACSAGQRWTPTDELIAEANHTVLQRIVAQTGI